ncbi:MAG: alcohol dehydrogenase catalytic domain-containing protein [candidate division Zixibacteria bacterium]|nr:alcohol dehydrogenase catalytic domain-containing protein [candidate division Zixibacteria bacterium]
MSDKMLAALKTKRAAGAELIEVNIPQPKPDEVLVKIKACSICGTDKHIYTWDKWSQSRIKTPMIFGHECCAEVVEVGSHVKNVKMGDYISAETHIPCQYCYQCRTGNMHLCQNLSILGVDINGIFAEYAAIPEICCWKNDSSLPIDVASIQEPLGNATYTVMESRVQAKKIAIIGDGPIAAFACGISRAVGAAKIYNLGMMPFNLDICRRMGADISINVTTEKKYVERIIDETDGGVDVVLDMAGNKNAVTDGFNILRRMGTFTAFGIASEPFEFDMANNVVFKGANVIGISGRKMFETWYQLKNLLDTGKVDVKPAISHRFPFTDFIKAMDLATSTAVPSAKIVLLMSPEI